MIKIHNFAKVYCVSLLLLGSIACKKQTEPEPVVYRPVITHIVKPAEMNIERRFSGQVVAAEGTGISFEVNGRVIEVLAITGKRYEKGAPLARVDDTDYSNQLIDAKAQFTNAEQELRRIQRLYENKNVSQSQLDSAIAKEQSARANFKRVQKFVEDCILSMPYSGVIGRVEIEPQQVIAIGQKAMTIQGENGLEFVIGVPAEDISSLNNGMKAEVTIGAFSKNQFQASISEISPEVSNNTTYPVTLTLNKQGEGAATIRPGLDGEAKLLLPNPSGMTLKVPATSVAAAPDGSKFVWIVNSTANNLAQVNKRPVQSAGLAKNNMIEIIQGLEVGDIVVMRGINHLKNNMTVTLRD